MLGVRDPSPASCQIHARLRSWASASGRGMRLGAEQRADSERLTVPIRQADLGNRYEAGDVRLLRAGVEVLGREHNH